MSGLTFSVAEHALEVIEATWPKAEIEWLAQLPAHELEPFIMLAALGARPVHESML